MVFSKLYLSYIRDHACHTLMGSATYVHTPNQMGRVCSPAPGVWSGMGEPGPVQPPPLAVGRQGTASASP